MNVSSWKCNIKSYCILTFMSNAPLAALSQKYSELENNCIFQTFTDLYSE